MRFRSFTIDNYRAIVGPLLIDISRTSLAPIIGVNESGKTTILHAIFAFDWYNDTLNDSGRHLRDTTNLYKTSSPPARISAVMEVSRADILDAIEGAVVDGGPATIASRYKRKRAHFPETLTIIRDLTTLKYAIKEPIFDAPIFNDLLSRKLIGNAPYILFFDDFRDSIEEKIEIVGDRASPSGWLAILEQLFRKTDKALSVFDLAKLEERRRKSVLAKVKKHLNQTLTKEWQNFRLDDTDALEISIEYELDASTNRDYLKLEVVEKDATGDEHYFFVRDRSKGFFWFFNFVMKLEFNPKVVGDDEHAIYLLDEPGSYLHASAQTKLCAKLRQLSRDNKVLYCTHSHYLLDPEFIPLGTIKVADKDTTGNVTLVSIHEHRGSMVEKRSAFQPVVDALRIKPFLLDLTAQRVVITEGIYDFYCFELFKGGRSFSALPSLGADSIKYFVSLLLAWRVPFWAIWDNDDAGRYGMADATKIFGDDMATRHFSLLPLKAKKNRRLEDLFVSRDLEMLKGELGLPDNTSFEKIIANLYFHATRTELLNKVTRETKENFDEVFAGIKIY